MKNIYRSHVLASVLTVASLVCGGAQAAVQVGNSSSSGVASGQTPELMLVIWDPIKEVSFTKDLGVSVYGENYALGNTATNLFVYGQQDAGYQKLFSPLNSDANFQNFLTKSTNVNDQIWAVVAVAFDPDLPVSLGSHALYSTLNSAAPSGTLNPQYTRLMNWTQSDFAGGVGGLAEYFAAVSNQCTGTDCTTNYSANLSTSNVKGELQYAGTAFSTSSYGPAGGSLTETPNIFNKVNSSSWFYQSTVLTDVADQHGAVDEFDNLGHDAYWGLGVNAQGEYILSYTMEASLTQAQTLQGQMLRLRTDFAAHYGNTRLIGAPVSDTLDLSGGAITPVPEPSTWGLMGLGLALLAGRARRQKNDA